MKIRKLLLIGTLPSTAGIGGVTMHVKRLCQQLDDFGYDYTFCDYKKTSMKSLLCLIKKYKVVHMHLSNPLIRLMLLLYCRIVNTKVIFTLHGNHGQFLYVKNKIVDLSIRIADIPIVINEMSFKKAQKLNSNCRLLTAFIPPKTEECYLSSNVENLVKNEKSKGKIIIVSNASRYVLSDAGEEIYGINFLVDYFKKNWNYFLCISDPSGDYQKHYANEAYSNIKFITEEHSFFRLLQLADIMVRPTSTDGDALSVREGLFLNKKVIATNRVNRPQGVMLYEYNDEDSFTKALNAPIIENFRVDKNDFLERLLGIYNSVLIN